MLKLSASPSHLSIKTLYYSIYQFIKLYIYGDAVYSRRFEW